MSVVRAFIAIEIPASLQDAIQRQTARLRDVLGKELVRWAPSANIHLTLKFLGEIPVAHVDFLKQMLAREAETCTAFDLQISGLGAFPSLKQPRVLWLGLQTPAILLSLQGNIEAAAARLGYPKEDRAFFPHLTIGRVRPGLKMGDLQKVGREMATVQLGNIAPARVDSVHLFKSDLKPSGPVYTILFDARLKAGASPEMHYQER